MICDICGQNEAVVVINKIMNNTKHELHLCMKCAKERGLITKNGRLEMSLEGLFENISASKNNDRLCPVCGCKLSEIKKTFKVGCPECYSIFSDEIKKMLEQKGFAGSYTGSMPERLANFRSVLTDRMYLQARMEESVEKEDYEKAAIYRDRLKALEKSAVADGSDGETLYE